MSNHKMLAKKKKIKGRGGESSIFNEGEKKEKKKSRKLK